MSVTIPLKTIVTNTAGTDKSQNQQLEGRSTSCQGSPDRITPYECECKDDTRDECLPKGQVTAEKRGQACHMDLPLDSCEHPLFPSLPSYGSPTFARKMRYYATRVISFFFSLGFLIFIFIGALACTAGSAISDLVSRLNGHERRSERAFHAEEHTRRVARAESDKKWHIRQQKKYVDEEQGPEECPPLEGGRDPIVGDVAYYARRVGLDVETFRVQTEDGFILTLWHVYNPQEYAALSVEERRERGPSVFGESKKLDSSRAGSNRRYPVLLVHGLLQSAGTFCTNDDDSLAFYLCKAGYDVWLGNNRCGLHPEHTNLSSSDPQMWSWDIRHLGTLDLAALTSRVLYETAFEKLGLVCHSQGTTQTFIALAKEHRPELGERFSVFCALAPAAYAGPLVEKSYFRFMSVLSPDIFRLFFGIHSFIPFMMTVRSVAHSKIYGTLAYWVFSFLFGWSDARWERDLRDRFFQFSPVYVSTELMRWWLGSESFAKHKCILSTIDEVNNDQKRTGTGKDHGDDPGDPCLGGRKDTSWYGPQVPPFALWIGGSDELVDGRRLLDRFQLGCEPHIRLVHSKVIDEYEHLDVLWAMDAIEQVGKEVSQVIWTTVPEEVRDSCRVPRGIKPNFVNMDQ